MIRNIDRLRAQGILVSGSWLNKNVLMLNEAINSTIQSKGMSPSSGGGNPRSLDDADSIFNIELSKIEKVSNAKDLMSATYQTGRRPKNDSCSSRPQRINENQISHSEKEAASAVRVPFEEDLHCVTDQHNEEGRGQEISK